MSLIEDQKKLQDRIKSLEQEKFDVSERLKQARKELNHFIEQNGDVIERDKKKKVFKERKQELEQRYENDTKFRNNFHEMKKKMNELSLGDFCKWLHKKED